MCILRLLALKQKAIMLLQKADQKVFVIQGSNVNKNFGSFVEPWELTI